MKTLLRNTIAAAVTGLTVLTGTGTAQAAVTTTQLKNLTLPAGHPCEYMGPDFEGSVTLEGGYLTDGLAYLRLKRTILVDANGDGRGDGIAGIMCRGITGPHGTVLAVRYDGRTGPAAVIPFRADADARFPALDTGYTTDVHLSPDSRRLVVNAVAFRRTDALASPSAAVRLVYRLGGPAPVLLSVTQTR